MVLIRLNPQSKITEQSKKIENTEQSEESMHFQDHFNLKQKQNQEGTCKKDQKNDQSHVSMNDRSINIDNKQLSLTQKEMYSHSLIRQIYERSLKKVKVNQINHIDCSMVLYKQYSRKDDQKIEQSEKSNNKKIIEQIYKNIYQPTSIKERIQQTSKRYPQMSPRLNLKCNQNYKSSRKSFTNSKVAVSGLVSYNFKSVNAKRNLAFKMESDQSVLSNSLQKLKQRNQKSINRSQNILQRTSSKRAKTVYEFNQGLDPRVQNIKTEKYLKILSKESDLENEIYSQKLKNYELKKKFMIESGQNQQNADFLINEIKQAKQNDKLYFNLHNKRYKHLFPQKIKTNELKKYEKEEKSFDNRRKPAKRGQVILSYLITQ